MQRIRIDHNALERVMAVSRARTASEAVNLALRFYPEQEERAARFCSEQEERAARFCSEQEERAARFCSEQEERAARINRHFERARNWGAVEDAERRHRGEKDGR